MTWFKGDDGFLEHEKVIALMAGPCFLSAVGLWYCGAIWCSKHLSNGVIPATVVRGFGPKKGEIAELIRVEFWSQEGRTYRYKNWERYQPLKASVEQTRLKTNQRVRRHRAGPRNGVTNDDCNGVSNAECNAVCNVARPVPRIPDPELERDSRSENGERASAIFDRGENESASLASQIGQVLAERFPLNPGTYTRRQIALLTIWLASHHQADPVAAAVQLADGFAADEWAQQEGYPLADLVNRPERYMNGHTPSPLDSLEKRAADAYTAGDLAGYREALAELAKLRGPYG